MYGFIAAVPGEMIFIRMNARVFTSLSTHC